MNKTQSVEQMLERLADLEEELVVITDTCNDARADAIPPEVQNALDMIAAEEAKAALPVEAEMKALTARIKTAAQQTGETVKGTRKQVVVYTREKWDGKGLAGFAVAVPAVLNFKSETTVVSIRGVK